MTQRRCGCQPRHSDRHFVPGSGGGDGDQILTPSVILPVSTRPSSPSMVRVTFLLRANRSGRTQLAVVGPSSSVALQPTVAAADTDTHAIITRWQTPPLRSCEAEQPTMARLQRVCLLYFSITWTIINDTHEVFRGWLTNQSLERKRSGSVTRKTKKLM
jgi:hypothetical protein